MKRGPLVLTVLLFIAGTSLGYLVGVEQHPTLAQYISCGGAATLYISNAGNLSRGYQNIPFSAAIQTFGGTAPYTVSIIGALPAGLSLSGNAITGTPTAIGTTNFTVKVVDSGGARQQTLMQPLTNMIFSLNSPQGISISPTTQSIAVSAPGTQEVATCTFTDGSMTTSPTCPVAWSVSPANGSIATVSPTGIPIGFAPGVAALMASFGGQVSNSAAITVTGTQAMLPTISTSSLPAAYLSVLYPSQTLIASGGVSPYTWALNAGSPALPTGVSLSSGGVISGTPSTGSVSVVVKVTDSSSNTATQPLTFTVNTVSSPIAITPAPSLTLTNSATQQMVAACSWSDGNTRVGCPSTLTWVSSAPSVATVNSSGLVTAAASGTGTSNITATVGSQNSNVVVVTVNSSAITITTAAILPTPCDINVQCPTLQLMANGGTPPYTWSITGTAPTGCGGTCVSSTGFYSLLPTAAGTFSSFTIQVQDAGAVHTGTKTFTQVVAALVSIQVTGQPVILVNGSAPLTATGSYGDGGTSNVTVGTGGGTVAWTYIQGNNAINSSTITAVVPLNNVVAGDTIICAPIYVNGAGSGQTLTSVKDQAATAFTATTHSPTTFLASVGQAWMYYQLSAAGGNETFTGTWSTAGAAFGMGCDEFRASGGTPAYDVDAAQSSGASGTANTGLTITPAGAGELIYAVDVPVNAITAAGAPFTLGSGGFFDAAATEYLLNSVTGANAINFAQAPAGAYAAIEAAFSITPTSGGVGTVWTLTGNAPCSVNGSGVVQGRGVGSCTVTATIGAISGSCGVFVNAPTDTTITVAPPTGSQPIGGQFTFSATGNPSGTIDTGAPTVWSSSSPSTLSMVGNIGTCNAAGSAVVTATVNTNLSGSTSPLNCTTPVSGTSLLTGCGVSASNTVNYGSKGCPASPPAGWTVIQAEGFEGTLHSNEVLVSGASVSSTQAHTGSNSITALYNSDQASVSVFISNVFSSFTSIYLSYWDYTDSNALYANSDYFMFDLLNNIPNACGAKGQDIFWNGVLYNPANVASASQTQFEIGGQGNTALAACQGFYQQGQDSNTLQMNAGTWRQYEFLITPSTMTASSGVPGNPPSNCSSPTQSGCGNGNMKVWVNGQLVQNRPNYNLNGTQVMAAASTVLQVGGNITSFDYTNVYRCVPFTYVKCQPPFPPAPSSYHRYIDDVILMKQ